MAQGHIMISQSGAQIEYPSKLYTPTCKTELKPDVRVREALEKQYLNGSLLDSSWLVWQSDIAAFAATASYAATASIAFCARSPKHDHMAI